MTVSLFNRCRWTLQTLCCVRFGNAFWSLAMVGAGLYSPALALPVAAQSEAPTYRRLRYEEDYRSLRVTGSARDLWDPIKFIPLEATGRNYLSIGGELRERFESYRNPLFGVGNVPDEAYLLHRLLLHFDVHLGEVFRAFVQFNNLLGAGRAADGPLDRNQLDLQQAFAEARILLAANEHLNFQFGRQEMLLGSGRLVTIREGPNNRLSFDGFRVGYQKGSTRADAFFLRPVLPRPFAFDDRTTATEALWGVYATLPLPLLPDGHADVYYLGFDRLRTVLVAGVGPENRHSFGLRLWGRPGDLDYDVEGVYQSGAFAGQPISAWTMASNIGYTFATLPLRPRLGLKVDVASGDRDASDGVLETFNPLYPTASYFSDAALNGPYNFVDLHPSLELKIAPTVGLTFEYDWLWRYSASDGVYSPPGRLLIGADPLGDGRVGGQFQILLQWQLERHTALTMAYSQFTVSDALRRGGAEDVEFFLAQLKYLF